MTNRIAKQVSKPDFEIDGGGSVYLLKPVSDAAKIWVDENIGQDNGGLRNPGSDHEFNDLVMSCQWDDKSVGTYAHQISYRDVYRVELRNCERMYKTLKKVDRLTEKFPITPTTFGQFVSLAARSLNIKSGRKESPRSGGHSTYSENQYIELSLSDIQYCIDSIIAEAREKAAQ